MGSPNLDNDYLSDRDIPSFPSSPSPDMSRSRNKDDGGWTCLLVLAATSTMVGSAMPFGYHIGVINTPAPLIQEWCNKSLVSYDLTPAQLDVLWSAIVSSFLVGGMIGSLAASWIADYAGRKGALIVSDVLGSLGCIMFFICMPMYSVTTLFFGRFVVGFSSGLTLSVMPMYLLEIAPGSVRGAMGVLTTVGLTFGVLLGQFMGLDWILGTESLWHYLLSLPLALILVSAVALPVLPESPKYIYSVKGSRQKALKELSRLRGRPMSEVAHELQIDGADSGEGGGQPWSVGTLLKAKDMRLNLALVCALQAGQQLSGINAVFYYSTLIFKSAGLSQTGSQYANLGAGLINFLVPLLVTWLANVCRRRTLVLTSCSLVTIVLSLLCISISFMDTISWMALAAIFLVLFYVFVYGLGLGPIPFFIASELFDVGPRPPAMALGSMANWTGNFLVGLTFPSLQRAMGQYSFLLFAGSTALLAIFVYLKLPETFNKNQVPEAKSRSELKPLAS